MLDKRVKETSERNGECSMCSQLSIDVRRVTVFYESRLLDHVKKRIRVSFLSLYNATLNLHTQACTDLTHLIGKKGLLINLSICLGAHG